MKEISMRHVALHHKNHITVGSILTSDNKIVAAQHKGENDIHRQETLGCCSASCNKIVNAVLHLNHG